MEKHESNCKTCIRKEIKQRKQQLALSEKEAVAQSIAKKIETLPLFASSDTILLYHSLPDEVCTHRWIASWASTKRLLLPVVRGAEIELVQYRPEQPLQQGNFQIWEPRGEAFTDYAAIGLAIIPGIAFDREGNRLGRGKGYYDRLLPKLHCKKLAVCYHLQLWEKPLPCDAWDIPMDLIVSEKETIITVHR